MGYLLYVTSISVLLFFLVFHKAVFVTLIPSEHSDIGGENSIPSSSAESASAPTSTAPESKITHQQNGAENGDVSSTEKEKSASSRPTTLDSHVKILLNTAFRPPLRDELWAVLGHRQQNDDWMRRQPAAVEDGPHLVTPKEGTKSEEDMPSFEEWRQEKIKLAEKEKHDQGVSNSSTAKKRQRSAKNTNKALTVCGAKVIAHNPEVENPSAVLTSNPDEYMLTPCKVPRKFFIVELCESIRVQSLDIGNLELFSNIPKVIQVAGSSRFPTREWTDLGRFEMQETRAIQNFPIDGISSFLKYIKVEYLEHYGKEHYCPLSTVRVFGTGMVDEYIDSVDDDDEDELETANNKNIPASAVVEPDGDEDAYMEDDKWGRAAVQPSNPISAAKDLIVTFVKRAASNGYNLINGAAKNSTPAPCINASTIVLNLDVNDSVADVNSRRPRVSATSPLLQLCLNKSPDVSGATCQYIWCLLQASNSSLSFCPDAAFLAQNNLFQVDSDLMTPPSCQLDIAVVDTPSKDPIHSTLANSAAETIPVLNFEKMASNISNSSTNVPIDPDTSSSNISEAVLQNSSSSSSTPADPIPNTASKEKIKTEPEQKLVENTTAVPVPPLNTSPPGQKESVFVRLGNRLKVLERNMTLSGEYLQELSRRFKKQGEDSARNFTLLFTKMSDSLRSATAHRTLLETKIDVLEVHNSVLLNRLEKMEEELQYMRYILPGAAALFLTIVLILIAAAFAIFRRTLKHTIALETGRLLASHHSTSNGFANGSVIKEQEKIAEKLNIQEEQMDVRPVIPVVENSGDAPRAEFVLDKPKKAKKRRKTKLRQPLSFARLVPS